MLSISLVSISKLDLRAVGISWPKIWNMYQISFFIRVILNIAVNTETKGFVEPIPANIISLFLWTFDVQLLVTCEAVGYLVLSLF